MPIRDDYSRPNWEGAFMQPGRKEVSFIWTDFYNNHRYLIGALRLLVLSCSFAFVLTGARGRMGKWYDVRM